ncbi:cupin domain-containing protein [Treponema primitia]|uniref:cupin domain-containing protein n=1 Tax=Treponema primitia TaxID=88058 RepID=UPI000255518C|nr:cupin domain-containing protein [Treponema primitia]
MFVQRNSMGTEKKEKMRGGEGIVNFTYFVPSDTEKNARMLAELSLEPGASIGYHKHDNETEYFIFISGTGTANDNGTEVSVKPGDVIITGNGASHGVKNTGSVPLVLNALIVTH